ncbi:MAG: hypothetical protein K2M68_08315 [Muribaculaceae bacterium]|nr:hypothetical protein [Muribaculaceae bacterium]
MKKDTRKSDIKTVEDEIVVDSRDVERARIIDMERHHGDKRVEQTIVLDDGDLLSKTPKSKF